MTGEMVKQVCDFYLDDVTHNYSRATYATKVVNPLNRDKVREMCVRTKEFIDDGRIEKAMRWLGFIQGILWCEGIYTIDEMRAHNTGTCTPTSKDVKEFDQK